MGLIPTCPIVWDGTDFSPCFRDNYLKNYPILLIILSTLYIAVNLLTNLITSRKRREFLTASTLTSPNSDPNLATLESNVIFTSVATNVLPSLKDKDTGRNIDPSPEESEKVLEDFKSDDAAGSRRWGKVSWWITLGGSALWLGITIGKAIVDSDWMDIGLPAFIFALSTLPYAPIAAILSLHLLPALIIFRSTVIQPDTDLSILATASIIAELLLWSAIISIPYAQPLDRLMEGGKSKGGGTMGSADKMPKHLEEPTSIFSRATYTFMIPLLVKHYWKPIALEDIPALREDDGAAAGLGAFRAFTAARDKAYAAKHKGEKRKRNLGIDLAIFFLPEARVQAAWAIVFIFLQYLPPTGLRLLLQYITERETLERPTHVAVLYIAMMAGAQALCVTALGQTLMIGRRLCIRLRSIIISEVFLKALRRRDLTGNVKKTEIGKDGKPVEDQSGATDGKIANLVAVDAFIISEICGYFFYLFSCPLGIIVNCVLLYRTLGLASFAGIAVLLLIMPIQGLCGRLYAIYQKRLMSATDVRLEAVTEVIAHIKLIKFNAWEDKFVDRMSATRRHELRVLGQRFATGVLINVIIWGTPVFVTATAFAVHSLVLHQPLTPDRAFSSLILFNMLRDPVALLMDTATRLLQSYTSCVRIQAYLDEPDTLKYTQLSTPGPGDPEIGFKDATFAYTSPEDRKESADNDEFEAFKLEGLNLSFPVGKLSMIVGPVGSGKTTLILSLLGETYLLNGKIFMPDDKASRDLCPIDPSTGLSDSTAFCAQTPWLVGASIKENIVFGSPWDSKRYNSVVDACALRRDFEIFELGDETEVGEKGTTCSGGQKARIALARAIYSSAKTIILDDVLSAVDAQTARHIYDNILQGPLTSGRTVILVTHAVSLVAGAAAFVVMLDDGRVTASGTPHELIEAGKLEVHEDEPSEQSSAGSSTVGNTETPVDIIEDNLDGSEADVLEAQKQHDKDIAAAPEVDKLAKQLVATETQGQGSISFSTYLLYFKAMGGIPYWIIIATCFFGAQILQVLNNAWIKDWANSNEKVSSLVALRSSLQASVLAERSTLFYLGVYCALSGAYLFGVASRTGVNFFGSLHASSKLYNKLLRRILGAKMRFFDSTPSGRIMNRLSKDISSIDQEAAEILMYFANCVLSCLAVLVVVVLSTPAFLLAMIVISVLYWIVGSLYVVTSREIKRIDSVTRSPLLVSFSEVLVGMSTIRSYGDSARFARKLFTELDQNTRCFWYLWQANRVLNNFSNFVGSLVTIFASVFALRSKNLNAGAVGLSITYALSFTEFTLWIVRLYAAAEMSMNSVERVAEYLDLEVEEEVETKGVEPPAYWPSRDGSVVVENLTCRYAPQLDPVLRDVSFTIGPKEKIGICGRTGSGKSTLALSFFRFLHQESGSIIIDGLDISKLSLTTLRSRLTILPQEAQLFSGTIRDNLDPFSQHEDYEIWESLRQCGLASKTPGASLAPSRAISRAASKINLEAERLDEVDEGLLGGDGEEVEERVVIRSLEEKVAVGGKNFSQGQRQLLALARGLLKLRHSSFLIMDESTANLDHHTDQAIQNVLRTGLADIQMLVIAHRLMTVCGLDKILVLDHGRVIEFGTPYELLQNPTGSFRELCRQSGEEAQLIELAKKVHEEKLASEKATVV